MNFTRLDESNRKFQRVALAVWRNSAATGGKCAKMCATNVGGEFSEKASSYGMTDESAMNTWEISEYGNTCIGRCPSVSIGETVGASNCNTSNSSNGNRLHKIHFNDPIPVERSDTSGPHKLCLLSANSKTSFTPPRSSIDTIREDSREFRSMQVNPNEIETCTLQTNTPRKRSGTSYAQSVRIENDDRVVIIFQKGADRKPLRKHKGSINIESLCKRYYNKMCRWMSYNVSRPKQLKSSRFIPRCLTGFHELDCQLLSDIATDRIKQGQEDELMTVLSKINEVFLESACSQDLHVNRVSNSLSIENIERA